MQWCQLLFWYTASFEIQSEGPAYTWTFFMGGVTSTTIKIAWELRHRRQLRLFLSAETFTKAAHILLLSFAVDVGGLGRLGSHSVAVFAVRTAGVDEHTSVFRVNQSGQTAPEDDINKPLSCTKGIKLFFLVEMSVKWKKHSLRL